MDYEKLVERELQEAKQVLSSFLKSEENFGLIVGAANLLAEGFRTGRKVFSCGNGGSHCDAMHFAEELTGRFRENRAPLPAIAISDPSHLSCVSNDYGYTFVFSRYLEALGNAGDLLLAISTSGNSENVLAAAKTARQKGMKVIALTGKNGGKLAALADLEIRVPGTKYADRVQEIHIKVIHCLIFLVEKILAPPEKS